MTSATISTSESQTMSQHVFIYLTPRPGTTLPCHPRERHIHITFSHPFLSASHLRESISANLQHIIRQRPWIVPVELDALVFLLAPDILPTPAADTLSYAPVYCPCCTPRKLLPAGHQRGLVEKDETVLDVWYPVAQAMEDFASHSMVRAGITAEVTMQQTRERLLSRSSEDSRVMAIVTVDLSMAKFELLKGFYAVPEQMDAICQKGWAEKPQLVELWDRILGCYESLGLRRAALDEEGVRALGRLLTWEVEAVVDWDRLMSRERMRDMEGRGEVRNCRQLEDRRRRKDEDEPAWTLFGMTREEWAAKEDWILKWMDDVSEAMDEAREVMGGWELVTSTLEVPDRVEAWDASRESGSSTPTSWYSEDEDRILDLMTEMYGDGRFETGV